MLDRIGTAIMVVMAAVVLAAPRAADAACSGHVDCPGDQLCMSGQCAFSSMALDECGSGKPCSNGLLSLCDEGFCKPQGAFCENPKGYCVVESHSSECECANGMGAGSADSFDPDAPDVTEPSWAELEAECSSNLLATCNEDPPDPAKECSAEALSVCEDFVSKVEHLSDVCDQGDVIDSGETASDTEVSVDNPPRPLPPPEEPPSAGEVVDCCEDLADPEMEELIACIQALEPEDCAGYAACMKSFDADTAGGGAGSDEKDASANAEDERDSDSDSLDDERGADPSNDGLDKDDDSGGCSTTPRVPSRPSLADFVSVLF